MRKSLFVAALFCLCTSSVSAQGVDLLNPSDVQALYQVSVPVNCAANKIGPFRPAPGPDDDDRADGVCWEYGTDSNYHQVNACQFSSIVCVDNCYRVQENGAQACASNHPNSDCSVNGSACETCQDGVRTRFNACIASCGA